LKDPAYAATYVFSIQIQVLARSETAALEYVGDIKKQCLHVTRQAARQKVYKVDLIEARLV
jgi:hypothetical protein